MTNKVNYALAPAGASHYDFFNNVINWLKYGREWFYFDNAKDSWVLCEQDEQPMNEKEIPARERELNRLADICDDWPTEKSNMVNGSTWIEWQQRRAERIEAGLIEVQESSAQWMPEVGVECEYTILGGSTWFPCTIRYILVGDHSPDADGWRAIAWCPHLEKDQVLTDANAEFRPLKTPEQKAKELRYSVTYDLAQNIIRPFAEDKSNGVEIRGYFPLAEFIYDQLTEQGVILTPLIKDQTK